MKPDETLLRGHLEEAPFLSGATAGKWGLAGEAKNIIWPHPIFWVQSAKRYVPTEKIALRFTLDGYPESAPTACPWNVETNARLDPGLWPRVTGKYALVFRTDWNGAIALYAPCDRVAMAGHDHWRAQFPAWWWQPHFSVSKYLAFVHKVLNPREAVYAAT